MLQTSHNIIKVGLVGKRNFLPLEKLVQPDGNFLNKNNSGWLLTGGFESDMEGLHKFSSLNELLLHNDAVIINDLLHANYLELRHIVRHCKHIFINQLFPLTPEELRTLQDLANEAEVIIQMGLHHRFSDFFMSVNHSTSY